MITHAGSERRFQDRREAGRRLAECLRAYAGGEAIVLGLPRGGVPVAYEVAGALRLPMDVLIVRKLGAPGCEELAMGALASGGTRVLNASVLAQLLRPDEALAIATGREERELARREAEYRAGRAPLPLRGRTVILVDDGLATGATMRAAVQAARQEEVGRCIVAVPVAPPNTCADFGREADEFVCVLTPEDFQAVGQFYVDFAATSDAEVRALLAAG